MGSKGFTKMSLEQLREYNREAQRRHQARVQSGEAKQYETKHKRREQQIAERKRLIYFGPTVPALRPTQEMLDDATRRILAPRPIVAWLMGDPPPGQSALDKCR